MGTDSTTITFVSFFFIFCNHEFVFTTAVDPADVSLEM
jgi:hypothetical protein